MTERMTKSMYAIGQKSCHVQGRLHGQFSNRPFWRRSMGFENECNICLKNDQLKVEFMRPMTN
jgi:hypothetical protein